MERRFGEALAEGLNMVMHPLEFLKSGVTRLLEKLGIDSLGKAHRISHARLPVSCMNESDAPTRRRAAATAIKGGRIMMMVLGLYVFMLRTVPFQELQYQRSWRHSTNNRNNHRATTQYLGLDNETITPLGFLLSEITGGRLSLLALEQIAELGKSWPFIEGCGTIYGLFVIESLSQTKTEFFESGMPRRIEFILTLKRVGESLSEMFSSLSDQPSNL